MTIDERCRGLRILVTPVRRGEGLLTTHCCRFPRDIGWTTVDPNVWTGCRDEMIALALALLHVRWRAQSNIASVQE
jgi:hypothetical protein